MTKAQLIAVLVEQHPHLTPSDVDMATRHVLDQLSGALTRGERIEIRGFGTFTLRYRRPRHGHNPKTGIAIASRGRHLSHFKPAKDLRWRVGVRNRSG
jgi:integration host factor subunit beta